MFQTLDYWHPVACSLLWILFGYQPLRCWYPESCSDRRHLTINTMNHVHTSNYFQFTVNHLQNSNTYLFTLWNMFKFLTLFYYMWINLDHKHLPINLESCLDPTHLYANTVNHVHFPNIWLWRKIISLNPNLNKKIDSQLNSSFTRVRS